MSKIITYNKNILEDGTVTVSPAENASYPAYRLYDRLLGRLFKFGSAINPSTIHVDQGTAPIEIDTLIMPTGHNLTGLTLTLEYSDNNSAWTTAKSWSQSGNTQIEQSFTASTHRYWRLSIASPSTAPQIGELFLTKSYTWDRNPDELDRKIYPIFNVQRIEDASGIPRFYKAGESKRNYEYVLSKISSTHRTAIVSLNTEWAGKNPFWMKDPDSTLIFGELVAPLDFSLSGDFADVSFKFLEVLA